MENNIKCIKNTNFLLLNNRLTRFVSKGGLLLFFDSSSIELRCSVLLNRMSNNAIPYACASLAGTFSRLIPFH